MKFSLTCLAIVLMIATSCVRSNVDVMKNKNDEYFKQHVEIEDDELDTSIKARLKITINYVDRDDKTLTYRVAETFSRCFIQKSDFKDREKVLGKEDLICQIYVSTNTNAGWLHLDRVSYLENGEATASDLTRIHSDVNCSSGSCDYTEEVTIDLDNNASLLNSILVNVNKADKSFYFKLSGKGGSLKGVFVASALKANINSLLIYLSSKYKVQVEIIN